MVTSFFILDSQNHGVIFVEAVNHQPQLSLSFEIADTR
jgi:hypothetical protein